MKNSQLYLEPCKVSRETVMNEAVRVANDIVNAIKKLQDKERIAPGRHASALMKLSKIFQEKPLPNLERTVGTKPQTSISQTRPENL